MKGLSHYGSPFVARQEGLCPGAARAYRLAALVAPSAKTVHRTVFFRCFAPPSLFESLSVLSLFTIKKMKAPV